MPMPSRPFISASRSLCSWPWPSCSCFIASANCSGVIGRALLALTLLALLALLARLAVLAKLLAAILAALLLAALHLVHAERLVHHLLLAPHDLAELVHLLAHLGFCWPFCALLLAARLQVVHHVLQLRRAAPWPGRGCPTSPGSRSGPASSARSLWRSSWPFWGICCAMFGFCMRAFGELAQELVHGLPQLGHQLVDFLVGRVVLQRLLQRFLRLAQPLLGGGQVAVLDGQRHVPQIVGDVAQLLVAPGHHQPRASGHDAQIVRRVLERVLGPQRDRVDQVEHVGLAVGVEREDLALLDDRPGERVGEDLLRHDERLRLARCFLAGGILRPSASASRAMPAQTCSVRSRDVLAAGPLASRRGRLSFISGAS